MKLLGLDTPMVFLLGMHAGLGSIVVWLFFWGVNRGLAALSILERNYMEGKLGYIVLSLAWIALFAFVVHKVRTDKPATSLPSSEKTE